MISAMPRCGGGIFHLHGGTDILKGGLMGSFVRRPGIMAGVALAGAALTLAVPAAAAQATAAVPGVINVPCNVNALKAAISTANGGGAAVLALSANCTYNIVTPASATDGLPPITGNFGLVGGGNTTIRVALRRSRPSASSRWPVARRCGSATSPSSTGKPPGWRHPEWGHPRDQKCHVLQEHGD
jgi:hypothetical protein